MLTVDFDRLGVGPGTKAIDIGAGQGRHSFEMFRRGAEVIAFDMSESDMSDVGEMFDAMMAEGHVPASAKARAEVGDALRLPYADNSFDVVLMSEILEHIPTDEGAINEMVRVLKPGGVAAVTVPRYWPEKVCWALSDEYHEVEGGHVRIYKASELAGKLQRAGLEVTGTDHAHALHAPYWWLKCAVGVENNDNVLVKGYHQLLVWDMMSKPWLTRVGEQVLNPLIGKSVALYLRKPETATASS
ncbi:methyltransferase domain-containing protein [Gordonia sp. JH63]|uniref:class I SAM-dependent methyltransferase n=1 Tax=unclassified Gordonia (in: high G+C Gram-positive bacteria) TaxID=2657482 RepID=UPI000991242B|nr:MULTISPECIES: class I SAM-dependent methyltransferase [unclassified Gordonia (in: high G+C Gram-positive bacteria)]MBR7191048.1 class I SAM-dependent methyltransferase [Gordonia sp. SCSIO 19800]MCX2754747.1 class I SAM-dependent methyltransferase [Gordonia sp. 4N]MDT0220064.1 class I SAM-dependent methyltransferase [Gordonia sp. AC31]QHD87113.1 methyltransferase domain-containing protein [Gordonia sp. JH63]